MLFKKPCEVAKRVLCLQPLRKTAKVFKKQKQVLKFFSNVFTKSIAGLKKSCIFAPA